MISYGISATEHEPIPLPSFLGPKQRSSWSLINGAMERLGWIVFYDGDWRFVPHSPSVLCIEQLDFIRDLISRARATEKEA